MEDENKQVTLDEPADTATPGPWPPLIDMLEKALEQARKGDLTSVVLLKAGPGVQRISDGYVAAYGGPEYDLVSILAQSSMARMSVESILNEIRLDRARMTELQMMLAGDLSFPTRDDLQAEFDAMAARGVTPLV
jgi:hypothetical protein